MGRSKKKKKMMMRMMMMMMIVMILMIAMIVILIIVFLYVPNRFKRYSPVWYHRGGKIPHHAELLIVYHIVFWKMR